MNPIAKELQNKTVKEDKLDDLVNRMKKMESHMMRINENNRRPMRNNNIDWSKMTCFKFNYLNEEDYEQEYNIYNMEYKDNEYDKYDEYKYDEYDAYEMENEDYVKENDVSSTTYCYMAKFKLL
ncbi:hypothetical protein C1645_824676 [Glomus cerebriforme]|uniref:Uncharacterized protein n=1 Tax=Glomus cerebriforme TaxID=658196 RepID=A0A397SX23_9GLOM|nr:hypothetical protein C1645_824676 [Glomus cerebriforme]